MSGERRSIATIDVLSGSPYPDNEKRGLPKEAAFCVLALLVLRSRQKGMMISKSCWP